MSLIDFWFAGFVIGFHLWTKLWDRFPRWRWLGYALTILALLSFFGGGTSVITLIPVSGAHGVPPKGNKEWRSLGELAIPNVKHPWDAPPREVLRRLHEDSVKRAEARIREEEAKAKQEHENIKSMLLQLADNKVHEPIDASWQRANTRKPPFCHITCYVHHAKIYDVEALPEICQANFIPKEMVDVPGWTKADTSKDYEYINSWPGPANPEGGFHSYKLYWANK